MSEQLKLEPQTQVGDADGGNRNLPPLAFDNNGEPDGVDPIALARTRDLVEIWYTRVPAEIHQRSLGRYWRDDPRIGVVDFKTPEGQIAINDLLEQFFRGHVFPEWYSHQSARLQANLNVTDLSAPAKGLLGRIQAASLIIGAEPAAYEVTLETLNIDIPQGLFGPHGSTIDLALAEINLFQLHERWLSEPVEFRPAGFNLETEQTNHRDWARILEERR